MIQLEKYMTYTVGSSASVRIILVGLALRLLITRSTTYLYRRNWDCRLFSMVFKEIFFMIKIKIIDILFTITKTIQERKCL